MKCTVRAFSIIMCRAIMNDKIKIRHFIDDADTSPSNWKNVLSPAHLLYNRNYSYHEKTHKNCKVSNYFSKPNVKILQLFVCSYTLYAGNDKHL